MTTRTGQKFTRLVLVLVALTVSAEVMAAPEITMALLNEPNEFGDVVIIKGDAVTLDFVVADDPLSETHKKDRMRLVNAETDRVVDTKHRGRELSGTVTLRARGKHALGDLRLEYVSYLSGETLFTLPAPVFVVGDQAVSDLNARISQLEATLALQDATVAELTGLVELLSARLAWVEADVQGIAVNAAAVAKLQGAVAANAKGVADNLREARDHKQLTEDVWITFESSIASVTGTATENAAAAAKLREAIDANTDSIAANTSKFSDPFLFESSIEELDEYINRASVLYPPDDGGELESLVLLPLEMRDSDGADAGFGYYDLWAFNPNAPLAEQTCTPVVDGADEPMTTIAGTPVQICTYYVDGVRGPGDALAPWSQIVRAQLGGTLALPYGVEGYAQP